MKRLVLTLLCSTFVFNSNSMRLAALLKGKAAKAVGLTSLASYLGYQKYKDTMFGYLNREQEKFKYKCDAFKDVAKEEDFYNLGKDTDKNIRYLQNVVRLSRACACPDIQERAAIALAKEQSAQMFPKKENVEAVKRQIKDQLKDK